MKRSVADTIRSAIDAIDAVSDPLEFPGIADIRRRLMQMCAAVESAQVPPRDARHHGLAHRVVDQWPLTSAASAAVIAAEEAFLDMP
jgi:hypothetical protein